jgi:hypothetical protein
MNVDCQRRRVAADRLAVGSNFRRGEGSKRVRAYLSRYPASETAFNEALALVQNSAERSVPRI